MDKIKINKKRQDINKKPKNQLSKNNEKKEELNLENLNNLDYLNQIEYSSKIDSDYRKTLDERMGVLMEKIEENINKNNYNELSSIISNHKNDSINNNKVHVQKYFKDNKNEKIKSVDDFINTSNVLNKKNLISESNKEENEKYNEEINLNKSANFPTKVQIVCKRDNELNNILLKRCKFLENETNYLKFKLKNVEEQKEFLQNIIMKNKNINRSIFDIFLVEYYKKIALNWKDISDKLIDELIFDEIYEFTNIKLKLRHIKSEKEKEEQKEVENNNIISPLEIEEFLLFNENLQGIKTVIRSVKESEKNLCKKYKVKLNNYNQK